MKKYSNCNYATLTKAISTDPLKPPKLTIFAEVDVGEVDERGDSGRQGCELIVAEPQHPQPVTVKQLTRQLPQLKI